jgi:hypothetical protein
VVSVTVVLAATVALCTQLLPLTAAEQPSLVSDSFDREASGLGTTETGQPWETPTPGTWATRDGEAYVVDPNPNRAGRTMALVDLKSDNGSVTATISGSAAGWGLVFRYRGPAEFWTLTAAPRFASYNITHVSGGRATAVDKVPMGRQSAGTVVTVEFQGPSITVLIDGRPAKTLTDPDGGNGGYRVGLVLSDGSTTEARWRAFEARRLPLSPSPTTTAGR